MTFKNGSTTLLAKGGITVNSSGEWEAVLNAADFASFPSNTGSAGVNLSVSAVQTDAAGNFYYAKSGRHALDSVVSQHGTLLKVSADGSKTDILATGFRAANGVCLNGDGTFFVTDQEGFWTPKNRINRVKVGGFYGNMFGYTSVTDESDYASTFVVVERLP